MQKKKKILRLMKANLKKNPEQLTKRGMLHLPLYIYDICVQLSSFKGSRCLLKEAPIL